MEINRTLPPDHNEQLWAEFPEHMKEGLLLYLNHRIGPGGFMRAVLSNDLTLALARADEVNQKKLKNIMEYIYNCCPAPSWGSYEKVDKWLDKNEDVL